MSMKTVTFPKLVGNRIRLARENEGLNQDELSEAVRALGVELSQGHLSRIERGQTNPGGEIIWAICKVLNVSSDYIFSLDDGAEPVRVGVSLEAEQIAVMVDEMSGDRRLDALYIVDALWRRSRSTDQYQDQFSMLLGILERNLPPDQIPDVEALINQLIIGVVSPRHGANQVK